MEGATGTSTAFALAGLGGFNAHGAGFLVAASDCGVVPNLVTATSGQIVVLADWLQGDNLENLLVDPELEHNALAQLAVTFSADQLCAGENRGYAVLLSDPLGCVNNGEGMGP
jgi:hypothetical protein